MSFAITDTQQMIADTIRRLLADDNQFDMRRRRLTGPAPERMALWPRFSTLGVIGSIFPELLGGFGGTARDVAVVLYEIGRSLAVEPYLACLACSRLLLGCDDDDLMEREIGAMLGGGRVLAFAHAEGLDPFVAPKTIAERTAETYELTGIKAVVRHADVANAFIVSAMLPGTGQLGCFLVEMDAAGLTVETYRLMDASGGGTLHFDHVQASIISSGDRASLAVTDALEWSLMGVAAEATGIIDALNEKTREYLRTRVQFGVPIGKFQALQHRAADMYIAGQELFCALDALLEPLDARPSNARSARVSALKLTLDRVGRKLGHEAVQLHGGMGVSDELDVSHYMRRLTAIRAEFGNEAVHRERFRAMAA